jgi:hypothetical protein
MVRFERRMVIAQGRHPDALQQMKDINAHIKRTYGADLRVYQPRFAERETLITAGDFPSVTAVNELLDALVLDEEFRRIAHEGSSLWIAGTCIDRIYVEV